LAVIVSPQGLRWNWCENNSCEYWAHLYCWY